MTIQEISTFATLALTLGNLGTMVFIFIKFINKPKDDMKDQIAKLEKAIEMHDIEIKEVKASLLQGNDRFRAHDDTLGVLIRSTFALLEFEVHYCETEHKPISNNLEKAKDELHEYLSKK